MQELHRVEEIGQAMRKRLDSERGVTHLNSGDQDLYVYTEDLQISPVSWEDDWGPLTKLQSPEQRLTHHFYAQALFSGFNAAAQGKLWLGALE